MNDRSGNDRLSRVNAPSAPWLTPGFYWVSSGQQAETAVSHFCYGALITLI
ncbi:hypothetical protein [Dickeya zeae]|uniref:hypothetical protein n=1 Tax=Dickeya zeae TaxID=204042 RepID=UPI0014435C44|nr:hypothetical protein [Dickeya zeae]